MTNRTCPQRLSVDPRRSEAEVLIRTSALHPLLTLRTQHTVRQDAGQMNTSQQHQCAELIFQQIGLNAAVVTSVLGVNGTSRPTQS